MSRIFLVGFLIIGAFFGISIVGGSWYTVEEGYRGIVLRNGAFQSVANPGLGWKMPLIDSVVDISVQEKTVVYDNVLAYSQDQQSAAMKISINYQLNSGELPEIYSTYQNEENVVSRLIQPRVFQDLKTVFGRYNAVNAIQQRDKLNADVQTAIQKSVNGPVTIKSVQIENIDFSDAYEASIEQRMLAEVEVQKLRQNAEREKVTAQITVTKAQAEADSQLAVAKAQASATLAKAQAEAESVRIVGEANASAIRARVAAFGDKGDVIVALTQAERWNGSVPQTMIPNSAIPFIGNK